MNNNEIIGKMNKYLHICAETLVRWLNMTLPLATKDWWDECVLDKLSDSQKYIAIENNFTQLNQFDLAALLRIADRNWYALRTVEYIPSYNRECIRDMKRVRNNWAHVSATLPGKDLIVSDLETVYMFLKQRGCSETDINDIKGTIEEVKNDFFVSQAANDNQDQYAKQSLSSEEIREKDIVYLVGKPSVRGMVMTITDMGEMKKYDVFVNGSIETFYSGQIAAESKKEKEKWIDKNTFISYLTAYQINNPSGKDLYSLNSARIDFVPYQFRPALKLIQSDEPRILIADSVGVGKTIEAGLIIKELQARKELENILVICPKALVAERKWELEMKRFDEDFVPLSGFELRQIISDTDRDGEWPARFNKIIIPYSILDSRTYHGENKKGRKNFGLENLDPAPHFDLVIVDEAHHIRNGSMEKEKAFEYKCVKYFCDHADAVVMLTATPLQTGDDDLFTLLNILRPDIVIDKQAFSLMSRPNAYITKSAKILRRAGDNWKEEGLETLKQILKTQWGENVISHNPLYSSIIKRLQKINLSREERVQIISDVESLHSFHSMINRTRRKDIQDFCVRRSYTLAVDFTKQQKELHDELLDFEATALLKLHQNARSVPFMMTTIKRQAASCIFGLAPHLRRLIEHRFSELNLDFGYDEDFDLSEENYTLLERLAQKVLKMADNLPREDPKFDQMLQVIKDKQRKENNKIIIFSTFRYTLNYIKEKLEREGFRVAQIDGSVNDQVRQEYRLRFELPKNNEDAIDIMLFTEVGSEGLDYQFCNMMINYDLPWNPMKIEQRIGRIDRRGQKSEAVNIYNVITNGTVDADIYYRCLMRIGVFENSIGECDEILGEIATKIDSIVTDSTLTDLERNHKLEQMADNEVRKIQELTHLEEEEKEFFGFDLSEYTTSKEIQKAENPWLTQKNLRNLIEQYLNDLLGTGTYILGDDEAKQIRLSRQNRIELRKDFEKLPAGRSTIRQRWSAYLKGTTPIHQLTFDSEIAEKNRDAFFITAMHPLAKQAAKHFLNNDQMYLHIQYYSHELSEGTYFFSIYAWNYVGLNSQFRLVVVCDNEIIEKELPDLLQDSKSVSDNLEIQSTQWESLEKRQVFLLMNEKNKILDETKTSAAFKIESLTNNYQNRYRSLEQKIADAQNDNIQRMFSSEMESVHLNFEEKIRSIKDQVHQTDIHSKLIANGILDIVREF